MPTGVNPIAVNKYIIIVITSSQQLTQFLAAFQGVLMLPLYLKCVAED